MQVRMNASIHERPGASTQHWLSLAAAPTFAIMALLTAFHVDGMPGMLCSVTQDSFPLTGTVPMYLLISVFHSVPWLKLLHRVAYDQ